jgi:hypothetical protein
MGRGRHNMPPPETLPAFPPPIVFLKPVFENKSFSPESSRMQPAGLTEVEPWIEVAGVSFYPAYPQRIATPDTPYQNPSIKILFNYPATSGFHLMTTIILKPSYTNSHDIPDDRLSIQLRS